jgi:hypothetical protein
MSGQPASQSRTFLHIAVAGNERLLRGMRTNPLSREGWTARQCVLVVGGESVNRKG